MWTCELQPSSYQSLGNGGYIDFYYAIKGGWQHKHQPRRRKKNGSVLGTMSIWQPVCICTWSLMSLQCVFMVWVVVKLPRPCELANFSHLGINLLRMATLTSTMQQRKDSNKKMQPMEDGNIDIKDADASKVWFLEQQWEAPCRATWGQRLGPMPASFSASVYLGFLLMCVTSASVYGLCC